MMELVMYQRINAQVVEVGRVGAGVVAELLAGARLVPGRFDFRGTLVAGPVHCIAALHPKILAVVFALGCRV